ncbi:MAG: DUF3307 domain-containing protein [Hungatella sp.]|nr:DUF3307 domain-containing protein [Hungatella sp.]
MMVLLLGHVLGDFYTQTEETAKKKESRFLLPVPFYVPVF